MAWKARWPVSLAALAACAGVGLAAAADDARSVAPPSVHVREVSFSNGARELRGVLYEPDGPGPFPALLFNHGSAPRGAEETDCPRAADALAELAAS